MTKKTYALVSGIIDGVVVIADAILVFALPSKTMVVSIVSAIGIASIAVKEICQIFVKDDVAKIKK